VFTPNATHAHTYEREIRVGLAGYSLSALHSTLRGSAVSVAFDFPSKERGRETDRVRERGRERERKRDHCRLKEISKSKKEVQGKKKIQPDAGLEPATSRLRACHSTD